MTDKTETYKEKVDYLESRVVFLEEENKKQMKNNGLLDETNNKVIRDKDIEISNMKNDIQDILYNLMFFFIMVVCPLDLNIKELG